MDFLKKGRITPNLEKYTVEENFNRKKYEILIEKKCLTALFFYCILCQVMILDETGGGIDKDSRTVDVI